MTTPTTIRADTPRASRRLPLHHHRPTLAITTALLLTGAASALPPVDLADVADGNGGGFVIIGIDPGDFSGVSVSSAGDVNGDGLDDVLVGADGADPDGMISAGETYVVFGRTGIGPVNLADVAAGVGGFVINGIDFDDSSGASVSGAGDVNGDGLDDLIIGAANATPETGGEGAGVSYVVFGRTSTAAVNLTDIAAGIGGGFVINGIDADDRSGFSVSGAGDVNDDGRDDLIIGAYQADPGGRSDAGESYVLFGTAATTPIQLADVAAGVGGFVIVGIDAIDRSGWSVSGAGDVNGDGLDDVLLGAPYASSGGGLDAGRSFVVFGTTATDPVHLADVAAGVGGFAINGIDADDRSGWAVSNAGDVNGDGLDDVVIGTPHPDSSTGESYVVFGTAGTATVDLADVAAGAGGGFVMYAIDSFDQSGASVAGAGDVNGDGLDDLIVGAPYAAPGGRTVAGESYVVFGTDSTVPVDLAAVAAGTGGFVMNGIDAQDRSGASVSGAGDVNGDGLDDLIVGAPFADPGGNAVAGESYVVFSPVPPANPCAADINGDGVVDAADLAAVLAAWGPCADCDEDLDDDGAVGAPDLAILLAAWGDCP